MDFSKVDLIPILRSSMPRRFADMPPQDFELFIARFFQDTGFLTEQIRHSGDYGVDVIATKEGRRIAIQVKRYAKGNKVGVSDVNQAIGGAKFYNCDHVIVITTSGFTQPARRLANEAGVELWDWNELQRRLSIAYLDGKSYQEYFGIAVPADNMTEPIAAKVLRYRRGLMKGNYEGALFYIGLSNRTTRNLFAQVMGATYITIENNQYFMRHFLEGYFLKGVIYAGCTVETCLVFDREQLGYIRPGDKIVLDLLVDGVQQSIILQVDKSILQEPLGGGSSCFISTAAFGTEMAPEVETLRKWRDLRLRRTVAGRLMIAIYYFVSPTVAKWIRDRPVARMVARNVLRPVVWFARRNIRRA